MRKKLYYDKLKITLRSKLSFFNILRRHSLAPPRVYRALSLRDISGGCRVRDGARESFRPIDRSPARALVDRPRRTIWSSTAPLPLESRVPHGVVPLGGRLRSSPFAARAPRPLIKFDKIGERASVCVRVCASRRREYVRFQSSGSARNILRRRRSQRAPATPEGDKFAHRAGRARGGGATRARGGKCVFSALLTTYHYLDEVRPRRGESSRVYAVVRRYLPSLPPSPRSPPWGLRVTFHLLGEDPAIIVASASPFARSRS